MAFSGEPLSQEWIVRWCGQPCYDLLWRPLFDLKFYQYANHISAAWMWARMRRLWRSRRNLMQEELGYIEGGSATLVSALAASIEQGGGIIRLGTVARAITVEDGCVTGVDTPHGHVAADLVISTVPIPYVVAMTPICLLPGKSAMNR